MTSEALELRFEGGRVSHSWCMSVVSHGYGGLGGVGMEVVGWSHALPTSQVRGEDTDYT